MESEDGFRVCDHCESSMDEPLETRFGDLCSRECYYAELNGPDAHRYFDPVECPGCTV